MCVKKVRACLRRCVCAGEGVQETAAEVPLWKAVTCSVANVAPPPRSLVPLGHQGLIFALQQFPSPSVLARPAPRRSSGASSSVLGGGFLVSGPRSWLGRARWRCCSGGRGSEGGSRAGKGVLPFAAGWSSSRVGALLPAAAPPLRIALPPRGPWPAVLRRDRGAGTAGGGCAGAGSAGVVSAGLDWETGGSEDVFRGCPAVRRRGEDARKRKFCTPVRGPGL